jgi:Cu-Zn family superoxide dismutase
MEVSMNKNKYRCIYLRNNNEGNFYRNPYRRAVAVISGGPLAPDIQGLAMFTDVEGGTVVCIEVFGLPPYTPATNDNQPIGPFGFHIHESGTCAVDSEDDPFTAAGDHWNPTDQPHGNHAGDFPVLFSNSGYANMCFFTDRFKIPDIINKSIIIHENPDDFRSQPSGAAGKRLACGVIRPVLQ